MSEMQRKRRMKVGLFPQTDLVPGGGPVLRFRELCAIAQLAEEIGFDSLWLADHLLLRYPGQADQGCWEAFTFLSGLAAATSRIQVGSLVACTSFRSPALLAKMADSLDEISGGRFILGLGAGWHAPEYAAIGAPFDHLTDRFHEALQIITPLLRVGAVDIAGTYVQARDAVLLPRGPSPAGPPIWVGARGPRMVDLAAQYADAWNMASWSLTPEHIAQERLRGIQACERVGRDPAGLELTANIVVHLRMPQGQGTTGRHESEQPVLGEDIIVGTVEEVAAVLWGFAAVGVTHLVIGLWPGGPRGIEQFAQVMALLDR